MTLPALADYAERYAVIAQQAGLKFAPDKVAADLVVGRTRTGDATTEFGALGKPVLADFTPVDVQDRQTLRCPVASLVGGLRRRCGQDAAAVAQRPTWRGRPR